MSLFRKVESTDPSLLSGYGEEEEKEYVDTPFMPDEWEKIRLQTAIWCQRTPGMRVAISKIYRRDKPRFISAAQDAALAKSGLLVSAPYDTMLSLRGIYGVLCEADRDPALETEVLRVFKRSAPDFYESVRKINRNGINKLNAMAWDRSNTQTHFAFDFGAFLYLYEKLRSIRIGDPKPMFKHIQTIRPHLSESPKSMEFGAISDSASDQCTRLQIPFLKYPANKSLSSVVVFGTAPKGLSPADANHWDYSVKLLKLLFAQPSVELVYSFFLALSNIYLENRMNGKISEEVADDIRSCWPEADSLMQDSGFLKWVISCGSLAMNWISSIRIGTYYTGLDLLALLQGDMGFKDYLYTFTGTLNAPIDDLGRIVIEYGHIDVFAMLGDVFYLILMGHLKSAKTTLYKVAPDAMEAADAIADKQNDELGKEVERLRSEKAALEAELRSAKKALEDTQARLARAEKATRMDEYAAQRPLQERITELEAENETLRAGKRELVELREFLFSQSEDSPDTVLEEFSQRPLEDIAADLRDKKVVVIGGHAHLQRKISRYFPNVTIFDGNIPNKSFQCVRTADVVILVPQHMCHSVYNCVMAELDRCDTPFKYVARTGIREFANVAADALDIAR